MNSPLHVKSKSSILGRLKIDSINPPHTTFWLKIIRVPCMNHAFTGPCDYERSSIESCWKSWDIFYKAFGLWIPGREGKKYKHNWVTPLIVKVTRKIFYCQSLHKKLSLDFQLIVHIGCFVEEHVSKVKNGQQVETRIYIYISMCRN